MRVSFSGNLRLKANTYSIKNKNGDAIKPSSSQVPQDVVIDTNKVTYLTYQLNPRATQLHMQNGDVITAYPPFNSNMYNVAHQLSPNKTLCCDENGKISIYNNNIDKFRQSIKSAELINVNNTQNTTNKTQKDNSSAINVQMPTNTRGDKATGLNSTYTLNGIEYDVVKMNGFDSIEDFQKFIISKGMTNKGKSGNDWPGQCHNFSCEYGDIMLGTSKIDLNSDSAAAQAAKGRDRQFQNALCGSLDTALQLMKSELEAGRPCVVKITKKGENHYGLVCGIRKNADKDNLKNTDFLYIDSYDGSTGQLNGEGYRRLGNWKNGIHIWKGKDYNFSYAVKNQYAKKFNSPADVKRAYYNA